MVAPTVAESITAVWRAESAGLVGALTRMTRDLDTAEDLAQDALIAALQQWPTAGTPQNPGAWLMAVAKRRAIDGFRRADVAARNVAELGHAMTREEGMPDLSSQVDFIADDALRLVFLSCHPALTPESRAALTLRLVAGLTTEEIARGFLVTAATMGQRIARAKRTLRETEAQFDLPEGDERLQRLDDVMAVVSLIFNEGYTATAGDDWMRPELTAEAIRLARLLTELLPDEPEVHGLHALLELQVSRLSARLTADGSPVLLDDQDRSLWDALAIRRGVDALGRAESLARAGAPVGRYVLQALIAAEHATAAAPADTDWARIAALYDALAVAAPGAIVEVNRAVAHGRAFGSDAGLAVLDGLDANALAGSHLVPSVRGDLLERAGDVRAAATAFREAAQLTRNERERALLLGRADRLDRP